MAGMLLMTSPSDLIPALNATCPIAGWSRLPQLLDKNTMGCAAITLRMSHELIYCMCTALSAETLVLLRQVTQQNGNSGALNQRLILFDEMTMGQLYG